MRKGCDGGETGGGKKRRMKMVATTSLPAFDHPNADRWNAVRLCQNDGFSVFQALDDDYCTYSYTTVAGLL